MPCCQSSGPSGAWTGPGSPRTPVRSGPSGRSGASRRVASESRASRVPPLFHAARDVRRGFDERSLRATVRRGPVFNGVSRRRPARGGRTATRETRHGAGRVDSCRVPRTPDKTRTIASRHVSSRVSSCGSTLAESRTRQKAERSRTRAQSGTGPRPSPVCTVSSPPSPRLRFTSYPPHVSVRGSLARVKP